MTDTTSPDTGQFLILEVSLTTGETQVHSYPIPPYGDQASIVQAMNMIKGILEKTRRLLSGEVLALENPEIAYNPAHVVRVKIDGLNTEELLNQIPPEQRPLGFNVS